MKTGSPVNVRRFRRWIDHFPGYHDAIANTTIESWIDQFESSDKDLAARILDAVTYITTGEIHGIYRNLLAHLPGWHRQKGRRKGNWFFVPFSGSVGESGDAMMHVFRMANHMSTRFFPHEFIHRSELLARMPGPEDTVVLVDDFAGTGNQARSSWDNFFQELFPKSPTVYLMLVGATTNAIENIEANTEMKPVCGHLFRKRDDIFAADCVRFSRKDKENALKYCRIADFANPHGYGACGLLVVLAHQCPNNSLPILHSVSDDWYGLFPRQ